MENSLGQMEQSIRGSIKTAKNMEKVSSCGEMIAHMMGIFYKTTFTDMESTVGRMEECTKENGQTTKCKERESSVGPMGGNMMGNM